MEYIEPLYLISHTDTIDEIGNVVSVDTSRMVYAKKKAVGSREFYNANAVGITPTAELQIRLINYQDEEEVIYKDKHYSVIRSVPVGKGDIVLVIGIKEGVN